MVGRFTGKTWPMSGYALEQAYRRHSPLAFATSLEHQVCTEGKEF